MRPRGKTQQRYKEAIQILSGMPVKNKHFISKIMTSETKTVKRREGCPQTALQLWDGIKFIRQQKQVANFDRLSAYMIRACNLNPSDLEVQLKYLVDDGLIIVRKSVGANGPKRKGIDQDGYWIPEDPEEKDGHDWYCFECHQGGELLLCSTCHRVYHELCCKDYDKETKDLKSDQFVCSVCKLNSDMFSVNMKKDELNTMLGYTFVRLKEKTHELHKIPNTDDEKLRFDYMIYEPMDLVTVEEKMKANEYSKLGDFYTDCQQIVHNVVVFYGLYSRKSSLALQMLTDCEYDLQEIVQCSNCYRMSNTKNITKWFCQPCNPPHELVYAKVSGYNFWPAKVIRKNEDGYDVRFFGSRHQRAFVSESNVRPITSDPQKLGTKKSSSFDGAYRELLYHQNLLKTAAKKPSVEEKAAANNVVVHEPSVQENVAQDTNNSSKSKNTLSRKRKASVAVAKPPPKKRLSSVPVKKNKKFYQESPTSSSPKNTQVQEDATPEDHTDHNLVSSSSQETAVSHVSVSVQTENEVPDSEDSNKVDECVENTEKTCGCAEKYEKTIKDLKSRLSLQHQVEKEKAVKECSEKLRQEMEIDKQKAIALALEKFQVEQQETQGTYEERCKTEYKDKLHSVTEQQKTIISETKKKQWCYNCETEAIYHCCWNTSYCSVECQQVHWHKEHKRTCRRKR